MPFQNHAAFLVDKQNKPLEVRSAPYTKPGPDEFVIRAAAVVINPVDLIMQVAAKLAFSYISNLHVLGHDVAGEIVEVSDNVDATQFKVGDRVVGHAVGFDKRSKGAPEGAFQEYVVLRTNLSAKIPDYISYDRACVIPLGFSTAACGLFQKGTLALAHPKTSKPISQDKTVLVWGGSTSVGANAIQLARAAGYDVTTASPKNFELAKELGASQAFDYNDPDTSNKIIQYLKGKTCAGALSIGCGSLEACITITAAPQRNKVVVQCSVPLVMTHARPGMLGLVGMVFWFVKMAITARIKGVSTKMVNGSDLMANEVSQACYPDFLGQAMSAGQFVPKPDPYVVGHGLEAIRQAFDYYRNNKISASKLVVTL
ncbi:putative alcohol dehydrogenase [Trematosphaeria pertusa]|uniref:Putative alcohol dehydrogenase n=1 Tax=Trematosphaeria pertusa TaxID=390896 RepID=A0A6A6HV92_9PLEO|nr:putative alcohol dehydrogenase [Trematosphaeria pertusa]KAF2242016.1 putative alcohol dehydrogenase [Trematosphaeria pertusa]